MRSILTASLVLVLGAFAGCSTCRCADTRETLDQIIIPEIEFQGAHIFDVITFLNDHLEKSNPREEDMTIFLSTRDPEILERDPDKQPRVVRMSATNISLSDAIKRISTGFGLKFTIVGGVVIIHDRDN